MADPKATLTAFGTSSLSLTPTVTEAAVMPEYLLSALVTVWSMETDSSSKSSFSSTPDTVKLWGVLQLSGVNVRDAGVTVTAPSSSLTASTVTSAEGLLSRTTS